VIIVCVSVYVWLYRETIQKKIKTSYSLKNKYFIFFFFCQIKYFETFRPLQATPPKKHLGIFIIFFRYLHIKHTTKYMTEIDSRTWGINICAIHWSVMEVISNYLSVYFTQLLDTILRLVVFDSYYINCILILVLYCHTGITITFYSDLLYLLVFCCV